MARAVRTNLLSVTPELKEAIGNNRDPYPCRTNGRSPDAWLEPSSMKEARTAREICRTEGCPIKSACLNQAKQSKEDGVWGGEFLREGKVVDRPRISRAASLTELVPSITSAARKKRQDRDAASKGNDPWVAFGGQPLQGTESYVS